MLRVHLICNSFEIETPIIYWQIEYTSESYSPYRMDLYRGETFGQPINTMELVVSGLDFTSLYAYRDTSVSGMHTHAQRHFWYKAYIYNTSSSEGVWTAEATDDQSADKIGRRIWEYKNLALKSRYGGRQFVALKRKTYGDTCASCWDSYLQRRTEDFCATCYDTGISGGFYQPIAFQAMMSASPKRQQMMLWGGWRDGDAVIFTTHYPRFEARDIIVDLNNRRWEVVQVRTIEKGLVVIEQDMQVRKMPNDDIIYTFSVSGYFTDIPTPQIITNGEPI